MRYINCIQYINSLMQGKQLGSNPPKNKKIKKSHNKNNSKQDEEPQHQAQEPITDSRFAKASYDPKFMTPSSKLTKVKIDKRFSKMLSDPSFNSTSKIDRYGRQVIPNKGNSELKEYYYMDEEEENDELKEQKENQNIEQQSEGPQEKEDIREWMQNYNEESSDLEEIDIGELQPENMDEVWSDQSDENVIKGENVQATKRLALCNYDWTNISAKDLMILFNSFKQKSGFIRSIKVYMSNFGKEKLQEEEKHGPSDIWRQGDQEEQGLVKKTEWRKSWKDLIQQRDQIDTSGFDETKLRKYQKDRLKYFYAVIQCDTKQTADEIYKECDGNQFQNSTVQFDLRFIPDEIEFDSQNLKEQCKDLPVGGEIKNFLNRAMGHSKVSLSWEDPELNLTAALKKKNWNNISQADLDKIDWGNYINEDDVVEEEQRKRLSNIVEKEDGEGISDWRKSNNKQYKNKQDIEITFTGGFQSKKTPKNKEEHPSLNKQKKTMKQRKRENIEERKKKREMLDLLVDDAQQVEPQLNLNDSRFQAVYKNPHYSIDPVDPNFDHRKVGKVFAQVVKRNKDKNMQ